jgi:hypothetical protein
LQCNRPRDARTAVFADHECNQKEKPMNETAASLWQLVRDDELVRRGAYVCGGVVWLTAAWADLKLLVLLPIIAALVYVLRERRGEPEDDTDLL